MDKIVFAGDSFTWGEGLELFIENDKWISQRKKHSEWDELSVIQDDESIEFRESHRFPRLVAKELGMVDVVDKHNGGSLSSYWKLTDTMKNIPDVKAFVIQLSQANRDAIHLTWECKCDVCTKFDWACIGDLFSAIESNSRKPLRDYIVSVMGCDSVGSEFYKRFFLWLSQQKRFISNLFIEHCKMLEERAPVYFIDTWDVEEKNWINTTPYVRERMIPLVDRKGNYHTSWGKWEKTFDVKRIVEVFPETKNFHPTPELHRYLAKSVVDFLTDKI
jgi:hypothetical protein